MAADNSSNPNIPNIRHYSKKPNAVYFKPERFNQVLEDQGLRLRLWKTALCPNVRNLQSESHDINCAICDNGMISYGSQDFFGIITGRTLDKDFQTTGQWMSGKATLTAPADVRFNYFDSIELLDSTSIFTQLLQRNKTNVDKTRYKVVNVKYLATASKEYAVDTDFKINQDGRIEWMSNNRPAEDEIYTIAYEYLTRYRVVDFIHLGRDQVTGLKLKNKRVPVRLPQQVVVMLDYLVDTDKDANKND